MYISVLILFMEKFGLSKKSTVSNTMVNTLEVYDSGWNTSSGSYLPFELGKLLKVPEF